MHLYPFFNTALCLVIAAPRFTHASYVPNRRATVCNGHAELCGRSYGNITFVGAHDSFAYSEDPFALARDQEVDIPSQLDLGVRLLQAQAHMKGGVLHFCHTTCGLFDGGPVVNYLAAVKKWLDANPNDVLTLLFTNPEGLSLPNVWAPVFVDSGVANYTYIPPSVPVAQSDWPTLGELIDAGTRVIVFLDAGADGADGLVDYILPEFQMIWETPFSGTDPTFPCSVNRTRGPLPTASHMYLINHSLNIDIIPIGAGVIISDPLQASTTNGITSILANAYGCAPLGANRAPSFVLLDFVNIGKGFQAANILNGLPANSTATSTTSSTTATATAKKSGATRIEVGWELRAIGVISVGLCFGIIFVGI